MKTLISIVGGILVGGLMLAVISLNMKPEETKKPVGSVSFASEYQGTFTNTNGLLTQVLSTSPATLGSVIITGASTGQIYIYNATTTDATKRAIAATSSLPILAAFPISAAVGTYTFDIIATNGLMVDRTTSVGTSTITWR